MDWTTKTIKETLLLRMSLLGIGDMFDGGGKGMSGDTYGMVIFLT